MEMERGNPAEEALDTELQMVPSPPPIQQHPPFYMFKTTLYMF
jgi:hypothetical protein